MSQLILSVACEMVFITIHVHCMFVSLFGVRLLSFSMTTVVDRGANFPAIFIPQGLGNRRLHFVIPRGSRNLEPILWGPWGSFGKLDPLK